MKKRVVNILLVVLAIMSIFVSCQLDNAPDETANVRFASVKSSSRGLNRTEPAFDVGTLYWKYEAKKTDNSGLRTGETAEPVHVSNTGETGLSGTVGPFSLGSWTFTLYGYTDDACLNLAYKGTATDVVIRKVAQNETNTVNVKVKAGQEASGTIAVLDAISLKDANGNPVKVYERAITLTYIGEGEGTQDLVSPSTEDGYTEYTVTSGPWQVNVVYHAKGNEALQYGNNTIFVNVFDNQKTYVGGSLDEITSDTKFETTADGGVKVAVTKPVNDSGATVIEAPSTPAIQKPEAVEGGDVAPEAKTSVSVPAGAIASGTNAKMELVTYNTATAPEKFIVQTGDKGVVIGGLDLNLTVDNEEVKNFSEPVTVTTYIAKNLPIKPVVRYNGGSEHPDPADTTYDSATGKLTFKTSHFSEYYVLASVVAYNASQDEYYAPYYKFNGVYTTGLSMAFFYYDAGDEIRLMDDVVLENDTYDYLQVAHPVVFDMNGHTIKSTNKDCVFYVMEDGSLTIDNGTIIQETAFQPAIFYIKQGEVIINGGEYRQINAPGSDQPSAIIFPEKTGKVTVNDGVFDATNGCYSIVTNGTTGNFNTVTVNGGLFKGQNYLASAGNYTINGGTFLGYGEDGTALYTKSGTWNITGGEFKALSGDGRWKANSNGYQGSGDAFIIESHKSYTEVPHISITGGTFTGFNEEGKNGFRNHGIVILNHDDKQVDVQALEPTTGTTATFTVDYVHEYIFGDTKAVKYSVWDGTSRNTSWYVEGAAPQTYHLSDAADLAGFAELVNGGNDFAGDTVILESAIDLADHEWTPIGTQYRKGHPSYDGKMFKGAFEGNGHRIFNLYVTGYGVDKTVAGFFGLVGSGAEIKNLEIASGKVINKVDAAGGIAGMTYGDVKFVNCINRADINNTLDKPVAGLSAGGSAAGGIVGRCYPDQTLTVLPDKINLITLSGCKNYGIVKGWSGKCGGLVGYLDNYYSISDTDKLHVNGVIEDSLNAGNVVSINGAAGGIIGEVSNKLVLRNCTVSGNISGSEDVNDKVYTGAYTGLVDSHSFIEVTMEGSNSETAVLDKTNGRWGNV